MLKVGVGVSPANTYHSILILLIVTIAFGDKLYLTNGDVIEGKMVEVDYDEEKIHYFIPNESKIIDLYNFKDVKAVTNDQGTKILWDYRFQEKSRSNRNIYLTCCIIIAGTVIILGWIAINSFTLGFGTP